MTDENLVALPLYEVLDYMGRCDEEELAHVVHLPAPSSSGSRAGSCWPGPARSEG